MTTYGKVLSNQSIIIERTNTDGLENYIDFIKPWQKLLLWTNPFFTLTYDTD